MKEAEAARTEGRLIGIDFHLDEDGGKVTATGMMGLGGGEIHLGMGLGQSEGLATFGVGLS